MCQTYSPRARIDQQKDQIWPSGRVCKTLKSKPASASFLEFLSLIFNKNLSETCKLRRNPDAVLQHFSNDSRLTERGKLILLRLYCFPKPSQAANHLFYGTWQMNVFREYMHIFTLNRKYISISICFYTLDCFFWFSPLEIKLTCRWSMN